MSDDRAELWDRAACFRDSLQGRLRLLQKKNKEFLMITTVSAETHELELVVMTSARNRLGKVPKRPSDDA